MSTGRYNADRRTNNRWICSEEATHKTWGGRGAQVFEHVPIQPRDAREASDVFYKQKTGDALLTYENEVQTWPQVLPYSALLPV